ncbi:MAG: phospholipase D-like domain-containing protein [Leptolyngbya sp. IPPAS B-1204]
MRLLASPLLRWGGLLVIVLLLFASLGLKRRSAAEISLLQPLPQDPQIQAYFNHSQAAAYTEPYRQTYRLGDDLEQVVLDGIEAAQVSIDLAVQELNLPRLAAALRKKHQAGVRVRVILENSYRRPLSQLNPSEVKQLDQRGRRKYQDFVRFVDQNQNGQLEPSEIAARDAVFMLQAAKVPLRDDTADGSKGSGLMHHKALIIDGRTVIMGSANFTWSEMHGDFASPASQGNANHLLRIESPALAQLFTQEFSLMWGGEIRSRATSRFGLQKPYRPAQTIRLSPTSQVTVQFSPTSRRLPWSQSVNGLIGRSLSQAKRTIDLALFVFSEQQLSNLLEAKHRQGVQVRALIEPSFAYRDYSEALDMLGVALPNSRCRSEANNRPWKTPITTVGVPQLPEGDLLHHKFGIIDGQTVVTGSQNWSDAANSNNDENLLVIHNPTVAAHFQREFERLYGNASLGLSATLQARIQQHQQRCRSV